MMDELDHVVIALLHLVDGAMQVLNEECFDSEDELEEEQDRIQGQSTIVRILAFLQDDKGLHDSASTDLHRFSTAQLALGLEQEAKCKQGRSWRRLFFEEEGRHFLGRLAEVSMVPTLYSSVIFQIDIDQFHTMCELIYPYLELPMWLSEGFDQPDGNCWETYPLAELQQHAVLSNPRSAGRKRECGSDPHEALFIFWRHMRHCGAWVDTMYGYMSDRSNRHVMRHASWAMFQALTTNVTMSLPTEAEILDMWQEVRHFHGWF